MKTRYLHFIICLLFLGACHDSEYLTSGNFFHLSHKGAKLPIWVQGNFNSDVIVVNVHGGPGDSGMEHHLPKGFQMLEEDYLMAYYDQRYSGMTQGHYDTSTQTPDQFIEDLEKVVQLIQSKYPDKKLFMLGHSWGGQLSAGYLGRDNHDELFKGWIDVDGSIYAEMEVGLMRDYIMERLPAKLAEPDANLEYWQVIIDFYENNDDIGNYSDSEPYWYVAGVGGDVYDYEKYLREFKIPYTQLIFKSMFSMSYYNDAFYGNDKYLLWDKINYTPELKQITIPALMLWGADDGVVPHQVADHVYENLGTPEEDKKVVKIPECCHAPQIEQPQQFYDELRSFIEEYKNK